MFAIPNGGARNVVTAKNLKAEGVRAGVLDIFLPVPRKGKPGLWIEMKIKPNKLSDLQMLETLELEKSGYEVHVCWSSHEAIDAIRNYLS